MSIGIVIYCDAGARPTNPGHVGYGLHGYKYSLEEPKKGTGLPDQVLTNQGYMMKSAFAQEKIKAATSGEMLQQITPINYIDGYSSLNYLTTNNVGELQAAIETLRWCRDHQTDISTINILADSRYVVDGTNQYLDKWRVNGWLRQDRTPIANEGMWKEYDTLLTHFRESGIVVNVDWVRGHNGDLGNEIADKYATVGILKAMRNEHMTSIEITEAEGYWKYKVDRHPFISHKRMYFNTLPEYQVPGQYYLGDHGRDDDLLGKKSSDGAFAFVAIQEPDSMLEMLRSYQSQVASCSDTLVMARLDWLYNPDNHKSVAEFQTYSMYQKEPYRFDLYGLNKEPVTRELRPAKLAIRAIEALSDLSERLDQYLQGDSRYVSTEITDAFFKTEIVKKKKEEIEEFKLRDEIVVGLSSIEVKAKYDDGGTTKDKSVSLTFGIDIPGRNSIKHMEELKPKIYLITWKESDKSFRYATVILTDKDKGIWAGVYSNLVVIND